MEKVNTFHPITFCLQPDPFRCSKQKRWNEGVGYLERETFEAFLKLPAPQRKIIREVILTFAKVHTDGAVLPGKPTV